MSKIVIFAGTCEGRKMSHWLCLNNIEHKVCVATEYGQQVLDKHPLAHVIKGRMDEEKMREFFIEDKTEIIIDATHPYATVVSENIKKATKNLDIKYMRLIREDADIVDEKSSGFFVKYFNDNNECLKALKNTTGNIFLTTGSKELGSYVDLKERLVVRVIPSLESINICNDYGIKGKNILAMQGPFSEEINTAILDQYDVNVLVTKASGRAGGFLEKINAARNNNIPVFIIGRPKNEEGYSFDEISKELSNILNIDNKTNISISLIGCGMGHLSDLTKDAHKALNSAKVVFGAKRLLESMEIKKEKYPYYLADDIIPFIKKNPMDVAVLFSGDTGFYSGAKKMNDKILKAVKEGEISADINIYPGISSISYFSAKLGESWDDANIISVHGKGKVDNWKNKLLKSVRGNNKSFVLLSGVNDLRAIGELLINDNLEDCKIYVGYNLSYPDETIKKLSPIECTKENKEGLYSIFIINNISDTEKITAGIRDDEFIRSKVPMTKEEVRIVSISKLNLHKNAVVYDVGSGTGSVAVEISKLSDSILVYAIEKKTEAVDLIKKNKEKFNVNNIKIIEKEAPKALENLPTPTHAFIGGSGGNIKKIVGELLKKNPKIRIVANAVSFETLQELLEIEKEFEISDFDIISLSATRTRKLGRYHMMQGENPVFICSFRGDLDEE